MYDNLKCPKCGNVVQQVEQNYGWYKHFFCSMCQQAYWLCGDSGGCGHFPMSLDPCPNPAHYKLTVK